MMGDIDLDNVGNNDGPPKPPETGTKPKDPILKPSQVTKQLDNLDQSAPGAVQSRLADHQTTNVNGQRLANQTSLSKKMKSISVIDPSTQIDTEAHMKQGKMPHETERDHTMKW